MTGPVLRKKIPTEKLVPYCGSEETGELFGRAHRITYSIVPIASY